MVNPLLDPTPPRPRAESLSCPACGAAVPLSSQGWAVSVACSSCGSILDATDPNLKVLERHEQRMRVPPRIPLGARGTWHGAPWDVIGFQEVTITVEETDYSWTEYVLFNPFRGFLYLSEYLGHWNVIEKLHHRPALSVEGGRPVARLDGSTFKHFQTAGARTTFAAGEFPWELRLGDTVQSRDFVAPPFMLSAEASDGETTWSLGTYTPPDAIRKAFGIDRPWPTAQGVFANQPNPHTARAGGAMRAAMLLVMVLVVMLVGNYALAGDKQAFTHHYRYDRVSEDPVALVTDDFALAGRPSNVEVELDTDVDNDWVFFGIALIDETSGQAREATKQVSYYHGTDSDGSWSEGARRERLRFASVPAGKYFLRVSTEGGEPGKPSVAYDVRVKRDVPSYAFYAFALLALVIPPVLLWFPAASFEQRRWVESDHAPASSDNSDSDDDE